MKIECLNVTKFSRWLRIDGHEASFAKVYINRPRTRTVDPELAEAGRLLEKAAELKDLLIEAQGLLREVHEGDRDPISYFELSNRIAEVRRYINEGGERAATAASN